MPSRANILTAGLFSFSAVALCVAFTAGALFASEPLRIGPFAGEPRPAPASSAPTLAAPAGRSAPAVPTLAQPTLAEPRFAESTPTLPQLAPAEPRIGAELRTEAGGVVESTLPAPVFESDVPSWGSSGSDLPSSAAPGIISDHSTGTMVSGVRYWIVSSRRAPQDLSEMGSSGLDVYERRCDGRLCASNMPSLQAQLHPGAPILISIHGSYVSWSDNLQQSDATWRWIRRGCPELPLNVIFFTWPSDRERTLLAPCELKRQGIEAEINAFYVATLLACLPDCHPVCLLGHSYGARMAMAALHLTGGGSLHGYSMGGRVGHQRIRAVLAAGALDHNWLNEEGKYCRALCRAECVLNLRNRHDVVLKVYPLLRPIISHRAIGASGVTNRDRNHQPCPCHIQDFDVTGFVPAGHWWPNYYKTPQLARHIASWVYFPDVNNWIAPSVEAHPTPVSAATSSLPAAPPQEPGVVRISSYDPATARQESHQPVQQTGLMFGGAPAAVTTVPSTISTIRLRDSGTTSYRGSTSRSGFFSRLRGR